MNVLAATGDDDYRVLHSGGDTLPKCICFFAP